MKVITAVKSCLFVGLATLSFGAAASYCGGASCERVYVGNPDRPNTVWVPGHYSKSGCWKEGYYIKFYRPVCQGEIAWVNDHYDYARPYRVVRGEDVATGHYKSGCHVYKYKHHRYYSMNSCSDNCYGKSRFANDAYPCTTCMMK